jgi:hypothetical protein
MNVGPDMGGNFGPSGQGRPDFGGPDGDNRLDMGIQMLLFSLMANADSIELPEGVTIPSDISSEDAIRLCMHILSNYVTVEDLTTLIEGSRSNGEFDPPAFPGPATK